MADGNRALGFYDRTQLSRSCIYEQACKTLAHRELFVLARYQCSACMSPQGTCRLKNAQNSLGQSQFRDLSKN